MKNTQGVPCGRGQTAPREPSCGLPHHFLRACLGVYLRGCLHADAVVRTGVIIEEDEAGDTFQCIPVRLKAAFTVDDLRLEDAVHTLCDGVVSGFVVLRHADSYVVLPELVRIDVTAVLYAPVRVVDESLQLVCRSLAYSHTQSLQSVLGLQCRGQAPAHNLVRVCIRHQMQVAAVVHQVNVCNITDPELVRTGGNKAADKVLVPSVAVVRVRRTAWLGTLLHQMEVAQQPQERVSAWHPAA